MMKNIFRLFLFIFSLLVSTKLIAQSQGDWYTPVRNKLIHLSVTNDSVIFSKSGLDSIMHDYGYYEMAFRIEQKYDTYYIVKGKSDSMMTYHFLWLKGGNNKLTLNIESLNNSYTTLKAAKAALHQPENQIMNITFFNKDEINTIRKQKDISSMTAADFKNFAQRLITLDSANIAFGHKKYKLSYLYKESTGRIILSELGFNSLVKGNEMDAMLNKFSRDPETKELFSKMTGGEN